MIESNNSVISDILSLLNFNYVDILLMLSRYDLM